MWPAWIAATCHRVVGKIFVLQVIIPFSASLKGGGKTTQNKHPPISLESRPSPACEKPQTQPRGRERRRCEGKAERLFKRK